MTFIKLSTVVINSSKIKTILMKNNKYHIDLLHPRLFGIFFYGSGGISSERNHIEICKQDHTDDYNIITNWINTNTKSSF